VSSAAQRSHGDASTPRFGRFFSLSGHFGPILLLALAACVRHTGPAGTGNLDGVTLPLKASPAIHLSVDGRVQGIPAEVIFEVKDLNNTATTGCFDGSPPTTGDTVKVIGDQTDLPEVEVEGLVFSNVRYRTFHAALVRSEKCEVTLGTEQLLPWALSVDVARRTVSFSRSRDREAWSAYALQPPKERSGFESHLIELTREPRTDAPLLAVRIRQHSDEMVLPFALSTGASQSESEGIGLRKGFQLLDGVELPDGITIPTELESFKGIPFEALEVAPGVGVHDGVLRELPEVKEGTRVARGVLGGDVWGRYDAIVDVKAGVLLLQRPRVLASGAHQRCDRGGALNEESCFELEVTKAAHGLVATGTVWRALPEGGRLHLDFVSDKGPLSPPCRMGFTFSATDRGDSTQHELPWQRLKEVMPACAQAVSAATRIEMSMFEDGELPECPGTCAFAQDLRSGRVSCECHPAVSGVPTEQERQFLHLYKQLLQGKKPDLDREREPDDPD
jgi:hypothetical protein